MTEAQQLVDALLDENLDSYEGGHTDDQRGRFWTQWPIKPAWHPGHRSSRMLRNRNTRRKNFGYSDYRDSMRDRGWPHVNRGFDAAKKKYDRAMRRFGAVEPGEGI